MHGLRGGGLRAWAAMALIAGCSGATTSPSPDAGPPVADAWVATPTDEVDILFVVDTSMGGDETQYLVDASLYPLLAGLFSGDFDHDGAVDTHVARSVHVAAVTMDLGPDLDGFIDCGRESGDDARFLVPDCATDGQPFIAFEPRVDSELAVERSVRCRIQSALEGCGYEQPLDAALKALAPAAGPDARSPVAWTADDWVPPVFRDGSMGHGGPAGANDGFLREESVLVLVVAVQNDDCSSPERGVYDPMAPGFPEPGDRCFAYQDNLYEVERYVEGLAGLRRRPERLVFATATGIPVAYDGSSDYDAILSDPAMVPDLSGGGVAAFCNSRFTYGYPAPRMVEAARGLDAAGAHVVLHSVCDENLLEFIDALTLEIGEALAGT